MKRIIYILVFFIGLFLIPFGIYAQENEIEQEESAELFLEDYSDDFQENFFEALKQKGIENYDRAINLLLKCKRLDSLNIVVDHELAKAYLADKQYVVAKEYSVSTVISEPENPWYLNTLVEVLQNQGSSIDVVKSNIPFENNKLKENLALLYYKKERYKDAKAIIGDTKKSTFTTDLLAKINDSIEKQETSNTNLTLYKTSSGVPDALQRYKSQIKGLILADSIALLQPLSEEALESYPSQPYFYYAQGYALNKKGKYKAAIEVLETALDYMLDDISLSNKIYQELANSYTGLNDTVKANMYLRKIK